MTKKKFTPDQWKADDKLKHRSITPPGTFEIDSGVESVILGPVVEAAQKKMTERIAFFQQQAQVLQKTNDEILAPTLKATASKLIESATVLEQSGSSAFAQYTSSLEQYTQVVGANSALQSLLLSEDYGYGNAQPIRRYNIDLDTIKREGGYGEIQEIQPKTSKEKSYKVADIVLGVASGGVSVGLSATPAAAVSSATMSRPFDTATNDTSAKSGAPSSSKLLHPLELQLIIAATRYLNDTNTGAKAVVVDIFERDKDGRIKLCNKPLGDELAIHTTVLYKQVTADGSIQIFVIDPSNSDFSKHLAHPFVKACVSAVCRTAWVDIAVPQKPLQIYSIPADKEHGPNRNQFRDCIDVALKLVAQFNTLESRTTMTWLVGKDCPQDAQYVSDLDAVQQLTNNASVNTNFIAASRQESAQRTEVTLPLRIRQSSKESVKKAYIDLMSHIKRIKDFFSAAKIGDKVIEIDGKLKDFMSQYGDASNEVHDMLIKELKIIVDDYAAEWKSGPQMPTFSADVMAIMGENNTHAQ